MEIGESQLQLPLYSRVDQPPGTKGGAAVFVARPNALYSWVVGTPGTKAQTFSPGCNNSPGLKVELQFS